MSHWFLPDILSDDALHAALHNNELALPSAGLPNLSRAQGPDQINEWLSQLHPEAPPERIAVLTQHFWRLAHELLPEDIIVVKAKAGMHYLIGEVVGVYRKREQVHTWPVRWRPSLIAADSLPALSAYIQYDDLTEITQEEALQALNRHAVGRRLSKAGVFRWVAIGMLIFELIYFWPRGQSY